MKAGQRLALILSLGVVLLHGVLSVSAARRLSPTWDEIIYPAAGLAQWTTGAITWNTEHGILSKLIYGLPLRFLNVPLPAAVAGEDEHLFGFRFTFQNRIPPQTILAASRLPAIVFSVMTLVLLGVLSGRLWGPWGMLLTLIAYASTPVFLARASLALLEMPMYFFSVLALALHWKAMEHQRFAGFFLSGAAVGCALACKLPALPLLPTLLILQCAPRTGAPTGPRLKNILALFTGAAFVVIGLYVSWKNAWGSLSDTLHNLFVFDRILSYYWHGRFIENAPAFLSLAAFALKAPIAVWLLAATGAAVWWRTNRFRLIWMHAIVFLFCSLGSVFFFRQAVTTVQFSPLYLALALLAGGGAPALLRPGLWPVKVLIGGLCVWAFVTVGVIQPNALAYFNGLAGGSNHGYEWLADSDQDWGQTLPLLSEYLAREHAPGLILAYSGAGDPRAWGLRYQDLLSPALVSHFYSGTPLTGSESRVLLAFSTKVLQSEPRYTAWLTQNRRPLTLVAQTFQIYDVTRDAESWRWMGSIYLETRRFTLARLAFQTAARLDPGNEDDRRVLADLKGMERRMVKSHS